MIDFELFKRKLQCGRHTPFQGLAYRCATFWHDLLPSDVVFRLPQGKVIRSLSNVYKTTYLVCSQYEAFVHKQKVDLTLQGILQLGFTEAIAQTVDATCAISKICDVDYLHLKRKEYWLFRNRVTHVKTKVGNRSGEEDVFDVHTFQLKPGQPDQITYLSEQLEGVGYRVRSVSLARIAEELQHDLKPVFEGILAKATPPSATV